MTFILSGDGRDENVVGAFRRYRDYLGSLHGVFPPSAYALATSDWYFDPRDHRCPHDAWLERAELSEDSPADNRRKRSLSLGIRLLGAYHNGFIELRYPQVFSYALSSCDSWSGHSDWRYDELRVSSQGHLVHEIEWRDRGETGGRWLIEASDLDFRWIAGAR